MRAVVTPEEMKAIDAAAPEPETVLIARAGAAAARTAMRMMGGTYGRTVNVLAGKGNNGNDGRVAAGRLAAAGVRVRVFGADGAPDVLPPADLVVDAAYGTGFRGEWHPPRTGDVPVLAVDIPSGVDGLTGQAGAGVMPAALTITFAALKPGLLFAPGSEMTGPVEVADIGLDVSTARAGLVEAGDVAAWWSPRDRGSHKWKAAVMVVAGSPGMHGAANLCSAAAMRAGAGMVHLASPGISADSATAPEVVRRDIPEHGWAAAALKLAGRFGALAVGPGLGRGDDTTADVRRVVAEADVPVVVDGDGLGALADPTGIRLLNDRTSPMVLTPHDGEFERLTGRAPGPDRIGAARDLAARTGAVVLLKGPVTVVADPGGAVLLSNTGDERLATAGTGDVLTGVVAALLAQGLAPMRAAAAGAWLHGTAAARGRPAGFVAGDLLALLPGAMAAVACHRGVGRD